VEAKRTATSPLEQPQPASASSARAAAGAQTFEKCSRFSTTPSPWTVYRSTHRFDGYMHPYARRLSTTFSLIDINGDARPDLVTTASVSSVPATPHWDVALNTGSGFAPEAPWAVPALSRQDLTRAWHPTHAYQVMDLDGDGRPDLVRARDPQTDVPGQWQTYGGASMPHWRVYRGQEAGFAAEPTEWPVSSVTFAGLQGKLRAHRRESRPARIAGRHPRAPPMARRSVVHRRRRGGR
jgi:hypothetical protein